MKLQSDSLIGWFVVRTLLWLPLCFFMWHFMAATLTWPLARLVEWCSTAILPNAVDSIEQFGYTLNVVTRFAVQVPGVGQGVMTFDVNPLSYGYGMPLLTALIAATPECGVQKWHHWGLGMLLLLLAQAWGVYFDILVHLSTMMGDGVLQRMGFSSLQLEGIALGYQFGYLMLPPLAPVVVWVFLCRSFIATLVHCPAES